MHQQEKRNHPKCGGPNTFLLCLWPICAYKTGIGIFILTHTTLSQSERFKSKLAPDYYRGAAAGLREIRILVVLVVVLVVVFLVVGTHYFSDLPLNVVRLIPNLQGTLAMA